MDNRFLKQAMILCLSAALTVSSSFPAVAAINNTHNNPDVYVSGTLINGVNTAGQTPQEARTAIESAYGSEKTLTLVGKDGKEEVLSGSELGLTAVVTGDLSAILTQQNENGRISGPAVDNKFELPMEVTYREEALAAKLASLSLVVGEDVIKTENAHIAKPRMVLDLRLFRK